jgi:hypothetical protein
MQIVFLKLQQVALDPQLHEVGLGFLFFTQVNLLVQLSALCIYCSKMIRFAAHIILYVLYILYYSSLSLR